MFEAVGFKHTICKGLLKADNHIYTRVGCRVNLERRAAMHNSFVIKGKPCQMKTAKALDFHIHAPQYAFRGMCMDLELMDWLNQYTFPEEKNIKTLHLAERMFT